MRPEPGLHPCTYRTDPRSQQALCGRGRRRRARMDDPVHGQVNERSGGTDLPHRGPPRDVPVHQTGLGCPTAVIPLWHTTLCHPPRTMAPHAAPIVHLHLMYGVVLPVHSFTWGCAFAIRDPVRSCTPETPPPRAFVAEWRGEFRFSTMPHARDGVWMNSHLYEGQRSRERKIMGWRSHPGTACWGAPSSPLQRRYPGYSLHSTRGMTGSWRGAHERGEGQHDRLGHVRH